MSVDPFMDMEWQVFVAGATVTQMLGQNIWLDWPPELKLKWGNGLGLG